VSLSTVIIALQALTEAHRQAQAISMLLQRYHLEGKKPPKEELRAVLNARNAAIAAFEAELDAVQEDDA